MTPAGRTVYVANEGSGTVTPIDTATGRPGRAIKVGAAPVALVITPNGRMIYVVSEGSSTVIPIATVYVANSCSDTVTPITIATNTPGPAIPAGYAPDSIAVPPDGTRLVVADGDSEQAFVVNNISGTVTPLAATGRRGPAVSVGLYSYPTAMTVTGSTAVVLDIYGGQISLFSTRTRHVYPPIAVGDCPVALALTDLPTGAGAVARRG